MIAVFLFFFFVLFFSLVLSCSCKRLKNVRTRTNVSVARLHFSARNSWRGPRPWGELGDTLSDTSHAGVELQRLTAVSRGRGGWFEQCRAHTFGNASVCD